MKDERSNGILMKDIFACEKLLKYNSQFIISKILFISKWQKKVNNHITFYGKIDLNDLFHYGQRIIFIY